MLRYALAALLLLTACDSSSGTNAGEMVVQARTQGLGFLHVEVGAARDATPHPDRPWVFHELRLRNRSDRTVYLDDHRTGGFLGDRELLVGDDGCGWGQLEPDDPVMIACHDDYRPIALEPGQVATSTITLWRGLTGMEQPHRGRYEFRKPIEYRFTARFDTPLDDDVQRGAIVLTYSLLHGS